MKLKDHPTVKWFHENENKLPVLQHPFDRNALEKIVFDAGADDFGVVGIDHPDLANEKKEILSLYPKTRSLVSIVLKLNPENVRCISRDVSDLEFLQGFERTNQTTRKSISALNEHQVKAMTPSAGFPMNMAKWPGRMWGVSHKTVAVAAGMGHMGHNRILIHPKFGNFIVLGTLLLDCEVTGYDAPLDYNPCIQCGLCVSVCPTGAISKDGGFSFVNCMVHNYRDRMGGFSDWVENIVKSDNVKVYRQKVSDPETVSMWQSLSYGICNKSSYCMAVCPAGQENIGPFLTDRKSYIQSVVKPLQKKTETVFVLPGSDAKTHVEKKLPHKKIKLVGAGLRPSSALGFIESLDLVFQKSQSKGIEAVYHFRFTGDESFEATIGIKDMKLEVIQGHKGTPDIIITADAMTWINFLAKEKNLVMALVQRKIKIKGNPALMKAFAKCFPL